MTGNDILAATSVRVSFRGPAGPVDVVRDVDLTLRAGEAVVLLGESGSGKTAFVRALMALRTQGAQLSGRVEFAGHDLLADGARTLRALRGAAIALISQDPLGALDPMRTVGRQLAEVLITDHRVQGRRAARDESRRLLHSVGFRDPERVLRSYPHQLSGGMRQRVAIAMAVSCHPLV